MFPSGRRWICDYPSATYLSGEGETYGDGIRADHRVEFGVGLAEEDPLLPGVAVYRRAQDSCDRYHISSVLHVIPGDPCWAYL
jgi:hypothetical protein